jgi:pyrimidine operon attenuation protein / uracil phosphoribosyltransferase
MTQILDQAAIERSLKRVAHEIIEHNSDSSLLGFVGIHTRGVPLAHRLAQWVSEFSDAKDILPIGQLDISFHRDDTDRQISVPKSTEVPFNIDGKIIVLVDDVLYTGRSVRAALNALIDLGRAKEIQLAVLIDRGHRELPIRADYVGKNIPTSEDENVVVHLKEIDGKDEVLLEKK